MKVIKSKKNIKAYINFLIGVLIWITFNNMWTNSIVHFGISKKYNIYISLITFIILTIYIFETDNPPSILTSELAGWSETESSDQIFDDIDINKDGKISRKELSEWIQKYKDSYKSK